MSAFQCSNVHINALVRAAMRPGPVGPAQGGEFRVWHEGNVHNLQAKDLGELLTEENAKSIKARYGNEDHELFALTMCGQGLAGRDLKPIEVLKAINCYSYQACEHDEWNASLAKATMGALRDHYIRELPGYEEAAWEINIPRPAPVEPVVAEPVKPDFEAALATFIDGAIAIARKHSNGIGHSTDMGLKLERGRKYIRVVRTGNAGGGVHCFIDTTNGDVLKADGWTRPAKHARGNIFDKHNGLKTMGPYGAAYL